MKPIANANRAGAGKKMVAVTGVAVSFLLVLSGCAGTTDTPSDENLEIQEGGTLSVGITGDPGIMDPTMANTLASSIVFESVCEKLYNANDDGAVFPQLAAEPVTFNAENTVATIALRQDVLFQDGTPFNADAVKYSLERHKNAKGSQRANELSAVDRIVVVDDNTVELHMKSSIAEGALYVNLSNRSGIILSPTATEADAGDTGAVEVPTCVGPFKYESRVPQDNITLTKDDNYYAADKVHLDTMIYRVISDSSVRATNLRSGDLDVIERVATTDIPTLESDSNVNIKRYAGLGFYDLIFNIGNVNGSTEAPGQVDTPLASDPRIRHAFEMSIDRDAINKVVFSDEFGPACSFMAPTSPLASDQTLSCSKYDPEGAKALMEKTGVDLPLKVELLFNQQPEFRRMGELIQQMTADAGFDVTLNIQESTSTVQAVQSGNFQIYINSWSGGIDADYNISRFAASDSPASVSKYSNSRVDELLVEARTAASVDDRIAAYDEMDKILKEDAPFIYLVRPVNIFAHQTNVTGLQYRALGLIAPAFAGFVAK